MTKYLIELDNQKKKPELNALLSSLEGYYGLTTYGAVVVESVLPEVDGLLRSIAVHVIGDPPPKGAAETGKRKKCKTCGVEHARRSKYCSTECYRKDLPKNGRAGSGVMQGKLVGG